MNKIALMRIMPDACGHIPIKDYTPQYWFQWGNYVVIEPVPNDAYQIGNFIADYPHTALTLTSQTPSELPHEFHSCIVDFACYTLSMKLKKWKKAEIFYGRYLNNLENSQREYIRRKAESKEVHRLPDKVGE